MVESMCSVVEAMYYRLDQLYEKQTVYESSWPRTTPATKLVVWASVKKLDRFASICLSVKPLPVSVPLAVIPILH